MIAGGTNSATSSGRQFRAYLEDEEGSKLADDASVPGGSNVVTSRLIESWGNFFLDRFVADDDKRRREGDGHFFANLQLVSMAWGLFWEELKLKYGWFVSQMDEVEEGDVLTLAFLGLELFGKFRLYPT